MELKKSYKGFVLWMIGYVVALLALAFMPAADEGLVMRYTMLVTVWAVAGMAFIIWRTESVYWYTGTEYEAAVEAGSERRRAFAWRHFRIFGWYALGQIAFCLVMHLLGLPWWIDIIVFCVGLCTAAFATMPIKL